MSDVVIKAEGLGKSYIIGHNTTKDQYRTLRDVATNNIKSVIKKTTDLFKGNALVAGDVMEEFWALKDIDFEIKRGDAVGVIGRNGAGKSTLLKILSRITEPSVGKVTISGRVASLLEVGTGFHPELSGRDNIFLNGAILGMSRAEMRLKFDEIVDFSGVEKFLDTPVKKYSSGMYVRLAFAVAAHLESEILIVDEVLAVGDAEFQKKCLNKIGNVSKGEGRTVFFVSHNIAAVKQLCNRGIFLENGSIKMEGDINAVVSSYTEKHYDNSFKTIQIKEIGLQIKSVSITKNKDGFVEPFKPFKVDLEIEADTDIEKIGIQIMISNEDTVGNIFASNTKTTNNIDLKLKKGINKITCAIERFNLSAGKYWLGIGVDQPFVIMYYFEEALIRFEVEEVLVAPRLLTTSPLYGRVYLDHQWSVEN